MEDKANLIEIWDQRQDLELLATNHQLEYQ